MDAATQLAFSPFLFIQSMVSVHGMVLPTIKVSPLFAINLLWKYLQAIMEVYIYVLGNSKPIQDNNQDQLLRLYSQSPWILVLLNYHITELTNTKLLILRQMLG